MRSPALAGGEWGRAHGPLPAVAAHVINHAYGLQASKLCHVVNEVRGAAARTPLSSGPVTAPPAPLVQACRTGRVDYVVQSLDKNLMVRAAVPARDRVACRLPDKFTPSPLTQVPVGGAVVASPSAAKVAAVAQNYPGRASATPSLDALVTLLNTGRAGLRVCAAAGRCLATPCSCVPPRFPASSRPAQGGVRGAQGGDGGRGAGLWRARAGDSAQPSGSPLPTDDGHVLTGRHPPSLPLPGRLAPWLPADFHRLDSELGGGRSGRGRGHGRRWLHGGGCCLGPLPRGPGGHHGRLQALFAQRVWSTVRQAASSRPPRQLTPLGSRAVSCTAVKEIGTVTFQGFGAHCNSYPAPYMTAAAAVGMTREVRGCGGKGGHPRRAPATSAPLTPRPRVTRTWTTSWAACARCWRALAPARLRRRRLAQEAAPAALPVLSELLLRDGAPFTLAGAPTSQRVRANHLDVVQLPRLAQVEYCDRCPAR